MKVALIILVAIAVIAAYVGFKAVQDAFERNSRRGDWAIFVFRWLAGSHWTGRPMTNAGFRRKGTKALTQTGYAPRFYFWPRWKRITRRWLVTFGPWPLAYGFLSHLTLTLGALAVIVLGGTVYGAVKAASAFRRHTHNRDWIQPLHERIAPLADVPLSAAPRSWLDVSHDRSEATLTLPDSFRDSEQARDRMASRAAEALGMEEPEIFWHLQGKKPRLKLISSPAPPKYVSLDDVASAIKSAANDVFVLGRGKRSALVDVSLHSDSPHIGASMGTGAGKSVLARFIAAQALYKGAVVVFLDPKRISHTWARGLPNVIYADTPELIHEALLWLGTEMDRRNEVSVFSADDDGEVSADVGPRIVIVAEELNLTANRLKSYWVDQLGGKGTSPALMALQDIAFAGRQVKMNFVMIGQMLTARVTGGTSGGNEARENVGVRILSRYTKRNWTMLVPEHQMPLVSDIIGRVQVVASGKVRETQVAYLTGSECKKLAVSGEVALLPSNVPDSLQSSVPVAKPGLSAVPGSHETEITKPGFTSVIDSAETESDSVSDTGSDPVIPKLTFSEVVEQNLFPGVSQNMWKLARRRDPAFPKSVGIRGLAHEYYLTDLANYWEATWKKGKRR